MQGVSSGEWRERLRGALREAQRGRRVPAISLFRQLLAAIDNAEARDLADAPRATGGKIAGSVEGAGAGDLPRRELSGEKVVAIIEKELEQLREAARLLSSHGRQEQADAIGSQLEEARSFLSLESEER